MNIERPGYFKDVFTDIYHFKISPEMITLEYLF